MTHADLLIRNGRVFTAVGRPPGAQAVAVRGNRIAWVGDEAEAAGWRGPRTEVIDAGGNTVMPGIIDSHFHLLWGSLKLDALQLDTVGTLDELAGAIRGWAAAKPDEPWIVGYQLKYTVIPPDRALDRHFLDGVVADRPVYLTAYDGHTVWVNSEALRRANLLAGGETPAGSLIVMDPSTGTASGELREPGAFDPVRELLPVPDAAGKRALLHKGLALAAAAGITSVHNMDGDAEQIALYAALDDVGELTLRVLASYSVTPQTPLEELQEAVAWRRTFQSSRLRAGAIKLFMDGVLESYTGLLVDDYAGKPGDQGNALFTAEQFNRLALDADRLGLQIFVHACGDGAVRRTLDGYAHAQALNGRRDSRHRVEHVELIHPDDIGRFAELGVIASMQPYHAPLTVNGGDVWPQRVGPERWGLSFAWETLRQAGAHLALGSDWPVVSMNPMLGVHAALTRQPWASGLPDQTQSLANILLGYTRDAAYAEFQEGIKGQLAAGQLADLVVLSADLFAIPPEKIKEVRPLLTVCDGRIVFREGR
jgi:predicted amidohydrolase YtcJ